MTQDEFYEKIPEWISKPKASWNHITLMAYFCHKYTEVHGVRFRLVRWNSDPGKGKESRDFSKLFKTFAPEGYADLDFKKKKTIKKDIIIKIYNYINWMFDYKFRRGDKSVTGTRIFLLPSMINEFERMYASFVQNNKSKDKMNILVEWAKSNLPEIFGLHQVEEAGDLRMIERYHKTYMLPSESPESILLKKAKEMELI
jgi:hypothetical protein